MARVYDLELSEVSAWLDHHDRGARIVEFQALVRAKLAELAEKPELAGRITRVTSRADASPHHPLKSRKKIALKLRKWRKTDPKAKVSDIHDIAGVTVICPYPSDVDYTLKYLSEHFNSHANDIRLTDCREIDRLDYRAYHLVVTGAGRFLALKCEMQIKTILAQGWGLKTHDLTYKPAGDIDDRLRNNIAKIGGILKLLDEQSEIIKDIIDESNIIERKRCDAAAQQHLVHFLYGNTPQEIQNLFLFLQENNTEIISAPAASKIIIDIDAMFLSYLKGHIVSQDLCRVACVYALMRPRRDRNDYCVSLIDTWLESLSESDHTRGLIFMCNALMSLGEYEECINTAEIVNKRYDLSINDKSDIVRWKLNYAYYLSEAYFHRAFDESTGSGERDTEETDRCGRQALEIVHNFYDFVKDMPFDNFEKITLLDTVGAVLIACAPTEGEVREGLELCKLSLKNSDISTSKLSKAVYDLHERRAIKRLISFH